MAKNIDKNTIFESYCDRLTKLNHRSITEKKIIITTEIDDDDDEDKVVINKQARDEFVDKAKQIGQFNNVEWVKQLVNGMKHAGVQGLNPLSDSDRPVTNNEIKQLILLLAKLLGIDIENS